MLKIYPKMKFLEWKFLIIQNTSQLNFASRFSKPCLLIFLMYFEKITEKL